MRFGRDQSLKLRKTSTVLVVPQRIGLYRAVAAAAVRVINLSPPFACARVDNESTVYRGVPKIGPGHTVLSITFGYPL